MMRRNALRAATLLALLVIGALALPIAQADHAYSHRYIVFGRVVDAGGNPVPGVTVNLGSSADPDYRFEPEGPCVDQPLTETDAFGPTRTKPVTNEFGEFTYCFHTHTMSRILPPRLVVQVDGTEYSKEFDMDSYLRHTFLPIQLDETREDANAEILDTTYTLQGVAWRAGSRDENLDGVRVFGFTVDRSPVNITFTYNGKEPIRLNTSTNNYGDWAVRVPIEERVESGEVTVEIEGQNFTEPLNTQLGTTYIESRFEKNNVPAPATPMLVALVALAALAVGARRRRGE